MSQGSVHNYLKLKMSQLFHGLRTQTCPLIEHFQDSLYRRVGHLVPVPANIQKLCTAIEEEWDNIPQCHVCSHSPTPELDVASLLTTGPGNHHYAHLLTIITHTW
jgi:hypothetical protein